MVLIYVLTLAIFPGVLAEDVSNSSLGSWRAHHPLPLATSQQGSGHAIGCGQVSAVQGLAYRPLRLHDPCCVLCLGLAPEDSAIASMSRGKGCQGFLPCPGF